MELIAKEIRRLRVYNRYVGKTILPYNLEILLDMFVPIGKCSLFLLQIDYTLKPSKEQELKLTEYMEYGDLDALNKYLYKKSDVRRGDIIITSTSSEYRNEGKSIWSGEQSDTSGRLISLDYYSFDDYGMIPEEFDCIREFNPYYWEEFIDSNNNVCIDLMEFLDEIRDNILYFKANDIIESTVNVDGEYVLLYISNVTDLMKDYNVLDHLSLIDEIVKARIYGENIWYNNQIRGKLLINSRCRIFGKKILYDCILQVS